MGIEDDDPPVVCRVTPEGEVICDPVTGPEASLVDPARQKQVEEFVRAVSADGEWGPNKIKLLMGIIQALGQSKLPDEPNIPRRSGEIIQAMKFLLDKDPPSILLFNYSTQPADVVGAFFQNKAELVRMQKLFDTFKSPKPH
jgi:hypothetical protein